MTSLPPILLSDPLPITPFTAPARGALQLPGSKSITNRALVLAALSRGESLLRGALFSEDTELMIRALQALGIEVSADPSARTIRVKGTGGAIPARQADLYVGVAGTTARFITALCCLGRGGCYRVDGTARMRQRPMKHLLSALEALGARIRSDNGRLPLTIEPGALRGGGVALDASESSQLLSALLMIAPLAAGPVAIQLTGGPVRRPYVEMTLRMMEQFGLDPAACSSSWDKGTFAVAGPAPYRAGSFSYPIEPDASAASYFLSLPALVGGEIVVENLGRNALQGDVGYAEILRRTGCAVDETPAGIRCSYDPRRLPARAVEADFFAISDTFLTLAALAPRLEGTTRISGIAHTRAQESNRVSAMAAELARLGQGVDETDDSLTIRPAPLRPATVSTYHDHRLAMSLGLLGSFDLRGDGSPWLSISDPGCSAKTFPDFFPTLERLRAASGLP